MRGAPARAVRVMAFAVSVLAGCFSPVVEGGTTGGGAAGGTAAGMAGGGGGVGTGGGVAVCEPAAAWDGGALNVSAALVPVPSGARVNDFDLGAGGLMTWVADGALWSRALPSGVEHRLADVGSNYASHVNVDSAGGVALVVGTGGGAIVGQLADANGPKGAPIILGTTSGEPPFVGAAWAGDRALVAWTSYAALFLRRVGRDGTLLDGAAQQLPFEPSTFVPRLAVASDGADWLVAVGSSGSALYQVTAAGVASRVAELGGYVADIELAHTGCGYVAAYGGSGPTVVELFSGAGGHLGGPYPIPDVQPAEQVIVIRDLACDGRRCLLVERRPARVDGFLLDSAGAPHGPATPIEATQSTGEASAVAAAGDGSWWVAYGTWSTASGDPYFGPVSVRRVR